MKPILKVMLITYAIAGAASLLAGITMLVISIMHDISPVIGPLLIVVGVVQLFGGIWLLKRKGRGLLRRKDNSS